MNHHPDDGSSTHSEMMVYSTRLTALHPRRLYPSQSPLREPEILPFTVATVRTRNLSVVPLLQILCLLTQVNLNKSIMWF